MTSKIIAPRQDIGTQLVESWRDVSASTLGHLTCEGYLEGLRPLSENVRLLGNVVTVKVLLPDGGILRDAAEYGLSQFSIISQIIQQRCTDPGQ